MYIYISDLKLIGVVVCPRLQRDIKDILDDDGRPIGFQQAVGTVCWGEVACRYEDRTPRTAALISAKNGRPRVVANCVYTT